MFLLAQNIKVSHTGRVPELLFCSNEENKRESEKPVYSLSKIAYLGSGEKAQQPNTSAVLSETAV